MVLDLMITTVIGLERFLAKELEAYGRVKKIGRGRVFLEASLDAIPKINYYSSLSSRVYIVLSEFSIRRGSQGLEDIYKNTLEIEREDRLEREPFAIRGIREPKRYPHGFTSVDIGVPAGRAVIERIKKKTGERIPVDLKNPTYEIFVEVIGEEARVMLNTSGISLSRRGYRLRNHPTGLNTLLARFMVKNVPTEDLCDPLCGSGTILLEARLERQGVPIGRIRSKTYSRPRPKIKPLKGYEIEDKNERKDQKLLFVDRSSKHIDSSVVNSFSLSRLSEAPRGYRVFDLSEYKLLDITRFPLSCPAIATDPPYGIRLGNYRSVEKVYKILPKLSDGPMAIVTTRIDLIRKYFGELEKVEVMRGDLKAYVFFRKRD